MSVGSRAIIVVLPIWRRHWAFAVRVIEDETTIQKSKGIFRRIGSWFWQKSEAQFENLKSAQPGTMKYYVRRVAERLVDQVAPEESFLGTFGSINKNSMTNIQVLYPASLSPKLVRRRVRLVCRNEPMHRCWAFIWGLATPLLFPLIFSPFSNIPVVYTMWRYYCHGTAMRGARFLYDAPLDLVPSDALEAACPPVRACQDQEPFSLQDPLPLATSIHWPSDQTQLLAKPSIENPVGFD